MHQIAQAQKALPSSLYKVSDTNSQKPPLLPITDTIQGNYGAFSEEDEDLRE